jgi:hypothetical protein
VFLSTVSLLDMSEGGAYAHNLFTGRIISRPEPNRETPYHPAHTTKLAGLKRIKGGDNRFYNNILVGKGVTADVSKDAHHAAGYGLWVYDDREVPLQTGGNVYLNGARPYARESGAAVESDVISEITLTQERNQAVLSLKTSPALQQATAVLVTSALLGKATVPGVGYENADGSPLKVDRDYFGQQRSGAKPTPGPFEQPVTGPLILSTW